MRKIAIFILAAFLSTPVFSQFLNSGGNLYWLNGNVGIGLNNPQELLHLAGSGGNPAGMLLQNNNSLVGGSRIGLQLTGNLELRNLENRGIMLYTNDLERMRIRNTGEVGIGTTNPSANLHVNGTLRFQGIGEAPNRILSCDATGNATWVDASAVIAPQGDNLGNHVATQDLNLTNHDIDNVRNVNIANNSNSALRFGGGQDVYSIRLGNGAGYSYGTVSSWAIKMSNAAGNSSARGWVWGIHNQTPIASLNAQGDMQLAGNHRVMGTLDVGDPANLPYVTSHLRGWTLIDGHQASLFFGDDQTTGALGEFGIEYNSGGLNFWKPNGSANGIGPANYLLFVSDNGNVGIGTDDPNARLHVPDGNVFIGEVDLATCPDCIDYRLFVREGIRTEKVKVDVAAGTWADYVFEPGYELRSLAQVKEFVESEGHLPGIPSAREMEAQGLNVAEMDARLLEKIEELTLYVIQLKADNDQLREKFDQLSSKIDH